MICFYIQVCLVSDKSKNYILSLEIIVNINLVNKSRPNQSMKIDDQSITEINQSVDINQ